ncbi:hypothetical protein FN846DRAFT_934020 [Sphaerosporella brunnea]|uniref:Chitin-binding type-2 domain-containing protein n=1 Tax=Sphaerosporella brunnea TaxID=1250544 RepID=A0A5J5F5N7_9PEZI|nr:hypothetical protein FN846DRAFT_934020 [Sphaerosporella brunnea]
MQFTTVAVLLAAATSAFASVIPEKRSPSGTCPPIYDYSPTTFLSDDSDCNVFYICDHSGPVKFNCPAGLHFSPTTWVCDFPNRAGCKHYY